jgi:hypothetical protein
MTSVEWLMEQIEQQSCTCRGVSPEILAEALKMHEEELSKAMIHALDEDGHTGDWKIKWVKDYYRRTFQADI